MDWIDVVRKERIAAAQVEDYDELPEYDRGFMDGVQFMLNRLHDMIQTKGMVDALVMAYGHGPQVGVHEVPDIMGSAWNFLNDQGKGEQND